MKQLVGHLLPRIIIKNAIGENKVVYIDPNQGLVSNEL